ncbi:MAG: hypothetical protein M3238_06865 [Actinomycetota bacterium]|nr:hypothetical protein [Actinomycetota bacterium]
MTGRLGRRLRRLFRRRTSGDPPRSHDPRVTLVLQDGSSVEAPPGDGSDAAFGYLAEHLVAGARPRPPRGDGQG